ncbi:hypothetical protein GCWU000324_02186 [Kingella oralis ATCC 51147]|uniref:Uncharacterized protein n=1 Tax=Kingella oralis ATCC 51147 TaxID=629741 RepID=C4GJG3_9NEIS|nr:hypothetical protein GCWU000324_02186 [Kingella oralis ATCC 51147]
MTVSFQQVKQKRFSGCLSSRGLALATALCCMKSVFTRYFQAALGLLIVNSP